MLVDKPLSVGEILSDENERERIIPVLNTIVSLIEENRGGSISVSISGDWGSGKTTYLRIIESFFRDHISCPVVFYEAWRYQEDDHPLVPLILKIREMPRIRPAIKAKLSRIVKPLLVSGLVASDIFLKRLTGEGIESIEKAFGIVEKGQLNLISQYRSNLKYLEDTIGEIRSNYSIEDPGLKEEWKIISDRIHDLKDKKVFVLLIDDLDRLLPEKAFKVIEVLRFYFDIDDVLIIMGVNDEILNTYINKHFGVEDSKRGERFLEKIFHWNYEISYTGPNTLHMRSLEGRLSTDDTAKVRNVLMCCDLLAHRKWIKLMNRIERKTLHTQAGPEIDRIVFSSVLEEMYPEFELFSRRFPNIFDRLYAGEGEDFIIREAMRIIEGDTCYLDFPKENYKALSDATRTREEEKEAL